MMSLIKNKLDVTSYHNVSPLYLVFECLQKNLSIKEQNNIDH